MKNIEFPKVSQRYYFKFNKEDNSTHIVWEYKGKLFSHYNIYTKELFPLPHMVELYNNEIIAEKPK